MIELKEDRLIFHFPEVHPNACCTVEFQRTLRLPDDNRAYALPPGLGRFPLMHVDDLGARLPEAWARHGGIFFPMYQAEAMWINFDADYPFAIKVAAGKVNAVTGTPWDDALHSDPQDYLVLPEQPWLDGFCVSAGLIRQFVAMPLGEGYSAEEQLTGKAEHGGLQIIAYPMKREIYEKRYAEKALFAARCYSAALYEPEAEFDMGLAPGGLMRQKIRADDNGLETWDTTASSRCYVHIANSQGYEALTGHAPPTHPPSAKAYSEAGLPWFEYYDEQGPHLPGSKKLAELDSVAAKGIKKGEQPLPENDPVTPKHIKKLGKHMVREEEF